MPKADFPSLGTESIRQPSSALIGRRRRNYCLEEVLRRHTPIEEHDNQPASKHSVVTTTVAVLHYLILPRIILVPLLFFDLDYGKIRCITYPWQWFITTSNSSNALSTCWYLHSALAYLNSAFKPLGTVSPRCTAHRCTRVGVMSNGACHGVICSDAMSLPGMGRC